MLRESILTHVKHVKWHHKVHKVHLFLPQIQLQHCFIASALYSLCSCLFPLFILLWILTNRWMANCIFSSSFQSVAAVCNCTVSDTRKDWLIEEVAVPKIHWSQPPLFSLLNTVLEWFLQQPSMLHVALHTNWVQPFRNFKRSTEQLLPVRL